MTSDTQTKLHETFNAVGTQTILYIKTNGLLISWLTSFPVTFTSLGLGPLPVLEYRLLTINLTDPPRQQSATRLGDVRPSQKRST